MQQGLKQPERRLADLALSPPARSSRRSSHASGKGGLAKIDCIRNPFGRIPVTSHSMRSRGTPSALPSCNPEEHRTPFPFCAPPGKPGAQLRGHVPLLTHRRVPDRRRQRPGTSRIPVAGSNPPPPREPGGAGSGRGGIRAGARLTAIPPLQGEGRYRRGPPGIRRP